jgi:hypothetical protein
MLLAFAFKKASKVVESLYDSSCTIIREGDKHKDPVTKESKNRKITICENQSCRVSRQSLSKNNQTDTVNKISYEIKLFIAPELEIKQGDIVEVINKGVSTKYTAGEGFPYNTHQEVILSKEGKG